jgi:hypothetical protein
MGSREGQPQSASVPQHWPEITIWCGMLMQQREISLREQLNVVPRWPSSWNLNEYRQMAPNELAYPTRRLNG